MLIQKRVQTFMYDSDNCYVYAITNGDSLWVKPEGEGSNTGLNIKIDVSLDEWIKKICPCVAFDIVSKWSDVLSDEALQVILFNALSGAENSATDWKITSLELKPPNTLYLTLQNENIDRMTDFLDEQEDEIKRITGVLPDFTSNLPEYYYNVIIDLEGTEQELSLHFNIDPSETDDCSYEVWLAKKRIMVTERSPKHWRRLQFRAPYKKNGIEYYDVETEEVMFH